MSDQDSTRSLRDIINDLRNEATTHPEARDLEEAPRLIVEALTEIERRLRTLEPCPKGLSLDYPHAWTARRADGSVDTQTYEAREVPVADHYACGLCGVRK